MVFEHRELEENERNSRQGLHVVVGVSSVADGGTEAQPSFSLGEGEREQNKEEEEERREEEREEAGPLN